LTVDRPRRRDDGDSLEEDVFRLDVSAKAKGGEERSATQSRERREEEERKNEPMNDSSLLVQVSNSVSDLKDDVSRERLAEVGELDAVEREEGKRGETRQEG